MINSIFGRINSADNVDVLYVDEGEPVTRFDESIKTAYPVDSNLSAAYEHPAGITLSQEDAAKIGLSIEGECLHMNTYVAFNKTLVKIDINSLEELSRRSPVGFYTDEDGDMVYAVERSKYSGDDESRSVPDITIPESFSDDFLAMALKATAEYEAEHKEKSWSDDGVEKFVDHARFSAEVMETFRKFKAGSGLSDHAAAEVMTRVVNEFTEYGRSGDFIYKGFFENSL